MQSILLLYCILQKMQSILLLYCILQKMQSILLLDAVIPGGTKAQHLQTCSEPVHFLAGVSFRIGIFHIVNYYLFKREIGAQQQDRVQEMKRLGTGLWYQNVIGLQKFD